MSIPTRNQWNQLKKAHSIPNGAVAGVNLGQELDKVDKAARGNNQAAYATTVRQYATIANTYITKLDAKKVKNYPVFQKAFLDDYLADAHKMLEGLKLQADGKKLYVSELRKFFAAVQKLDANTNSASIQKFSQFARGLSSVAKRTQGAIDPTAINAQLARIDAAKDKIGANPSTDDVKQFIAVTNDVAERIRKAAKQQGLFQAA